MPVFLKKLLVFFLTTAVALSAEAATRPLVSIVYGEQSIRKSDRAYSKSTARNLRRWLSDGGIEAPDFADSETADAFAASVQVSHLLNIDNPSAKFMKSLKEFIERGGRIVVYNSMSQEIGDIMDVKVEGFQKSPGYRGWSAFSFTGNPPLYCPKKIRCSPPSLRAAFPKSGGKSTTAAKWEDSKNVRTASPAVMKCPYGFWLTGLLMDDDTGESRTEFLTALSGACASTVWRESADTLYSRLWPCISGKDNYADTVTYLRKYCPTESRPRLEEILVEASILNSAAMADRKAGLLAAETVKLWELKRLFYSAYAAANPPWKDSVRAVWDHNALGLYPGDWDATCTKLSEHNITDLFVLVATPVRTHATVPGLSPTMLRKTYGDALAQAVEAGHKHGLRIHAWICALNLTGADSAGMSSAFRESDVRLIDQDGRTVDWLDPAVPAVRARLRDTIGYIVRNYDVDGIHLDYIRYRDFAAGWGDKMRADYERFSSKPVKDWPADVLHKGSRFKNFTAFKAFRIESLVKLARAEIELARPGNNIIFSTAVYGRYPLCIDSVGQDWKKWISDGVVDWVLPMNYAQTLPLYGKYIKEPSSFPSALRKKVISGIGVSAGESSIDAAMTLDQINATRRAGLGGFALFDLDMKLAEEILPYLPSQK